MFSGNAIFAITDAGLAALHNNDLPPSVLTSILRLVDGKIIFKTFTLYLKEHGDIAPLFEFLQNEGFIEQLESAEEVATAPASEATALSKDANLTNTTGQSNENFDATILKQSVTDYITANHPHVLVGVTGMFDKMQTKQDFIDHYDMYSRLIAGDKVNSSDHLANMDAMLRLP